MILEDNRNYFRKVNDLDATDKLNSEHWTDDQIEQYYTEQSNEDFGELYFDHKD